MIPHTEIQRATPQLFLLLSTGYFKWQLHVAGWALHISVAESRRSGFPVVLLININQQGMNGSPTLFITCPDGIQVSLMVTNYGEPISSSEDAVILPHGMYRVLLLGL